MLALDPPSPEATLLLIILSMASHSPCRTQGSSLALAVLPSLEARTASSGVLALTPLRNRGTCASPAPTFSRSTATIRPAVSPSAVLESHYSSRQQKPIFRTSWFQPDEYAGEIPSSQEITVSFELRYFPIILIR